MTALTLESSQQLMYITQSYNTEMFWAESSNDPDLGNLPDEDVSAMASVGLMMTVCLASQPICK